MFNNFAQQINTPNVSGNGHSVILAYNKSINCVMVLILNSQRPFLTTWYTFGKGGTLFATKLYRGWYDFGCENCTWWYLLFQLEKKGGTKFFKGGLIFSENIGPPGPFFSEIFGPGGLFLGGPIVT